MPMYYFDRKCYKFTTYISQLRATLSYCLIWPVTVYLWPQMQPINDQTPEALGIIKQITALTGLAQ